MQMLLFKHSLTNFRLNLPEDSILTLHDSRHNLPGNISRKYTIKPTYLFEYKLIDGAPFMFGFFPFNDLIIFDIINNKKQGSNFINVPVTVEQSSHHIIKLHFGIDTINDSLSIVGIDVLDLTTEQTAATDQHFYLCVHA